MVDLSVLNWLVFKSTPLSLEVPVLQVYLGSSDEIVTEEIIIVHNLNLELRTTWEYSFEVIMSSKPGIRFIEYIIITFVEFLISYFKLHVRIRETSYISRCKIISTDHVCSHDALVLVQKHSLENYIALDVCQNLSDF